MKQRKNAFTLIELLAVIIILAAIALIVAPLVLDIIKEQQRKTFKESINGILRSSRLEIVNSGLKFPATFTYQDGKLLSPAGKELKVTGKIPEGTGSVIYNNEDDIDLAIHDNTWCGTYNKMSKEVDVNEYNEGCEILVDTPESCFTVEDHETISYTINKSACETHFSSEKILCSGGMNESGLTLDYLIKYSGYYSYLPSTLVEKGVITITSTVTDGVTITGYNKSDENCGINVVIPDQIAGKTIKKIGNSAFVTSDNTKKIVSVVLPAGIEAIGEYAFGGNDGEYNAITSVNFSKAKELEVIQSSAFSGNYLTSVNLKNCTELKVIEYRSFYENDITQITFGGIPNLKRIELNAFCERNGEPSYDAIPSSVVEDWGLQCLDE